LGGILIIKIAKKISAAIPSQLLAVVFGILVVMIFSLTEQGVPYNLYSQLLWQLP